MSSGLYNNPSFRSQMHDHHISQQNQPNLINHTLAPPPSKESRGSDDSIINKFSQDRQEVSSHFIETSNRKLTKCKSKREEAMIRILKRAQQKYQRQINLGFNNGPSFNILKVLSSYKEQFPHNNAEVYNLIVNLMQKYKPKNADDWYQALQDIHHGSLSKSKSKSKILKNQHSPYAQRQIKQNRLTSRSSANTKILLANFIENCHKKKQSDMSSFLHSDQKLLSGRSDQAVPLKLNFNTHQNNLFQFSSVDQDKQTNSGFNKAHYVSFQPIDQNKEYECHQIINCRETRDSVARTHSQQFSDVNLSLTNKFIDKRSNYDIQMDMNKSSMQFMKSKHQKSQSSFQLHKKLSKSHYKNNHQYQLSQPNIPESMKTYVHTPSTALNQGQTPFGISKITQNTKQFQEFSKNVEDNCQQNEQWANMNIRAAIFYRISTEMKTFSALLANFSAYSQFRETNNKARHFLFDNLKRKAYQSMKKNTMQQKFQKEMMKNAGIYRQQQLVKKSFSVLKVLFSTKIRNRRRIRQISQFNLTSLKFIEILILNQLRESQSGRSKHQTLKSKLYDTFNNQNISGFLNQTIQTPKSLQSKANYFTSTGQLNKLYQLIQCFTHYRPDINQMKNFYMIQNNKILSICMQSWKKFTRKRTFFSQKHKDTLKLKTFLILKKRVVKRRQFAKNQAVIKVLNSQKLIKKSFNALLQALCTTKINSAKSQLIVINKQNNDKKFALSVWKSRLNAIRQRREAQHLFFTNMQKIYSKSLCIDAFNLIRKYSEIVQINQQKLQQIQKRTLLSTVFRVMKQKIISKKRMEIIQRKNKQHALKLYFNQWKNHRNLSTFARKCQKIVKSFAYRALVQFCQIIKKKAVIEQNNSDNIKAWFFKAWKTIFQKEKLQTQYKVNGFVKIRNQTQVKQFFTSLQEKRKTSILIDYIKLKWLQKISANFKLSKKFQEQRLKSLKLEQKIAFQQKSNAFSQFKGILMQNIEKKSKQNTIERQVFALRMKNMFLNWREQFQHVKNKKIVSQKQRQHYQFYINEVLFTKSQEIRSEKLCLRIKAKVKKQIINAFILNRSSSLQQLQRSENVYNKNLIKRTLFALAFNIIDTDQKIGELRQIYKLNKKRQFLTNLIQDATVQKQHRDSFKKMTVFRLFNSLRNNKQYEVQSKACHQLKNLKQKQVGLTRMIESHKFDIQNSKKLKKLNENSRQLRNSIFMTRFEHLFIRKMLTRKFESTAAIFRCQKLCSKTIFALQQNYCVKKGFNVIQLRKMRNNLSTEISF